MPTTTPKTVRNATYRQIGGPDGLLAKRIPFEGNSMSAYVDAYGEYYVLSYTTIIAQADDERVMVGIDHYSRTTSRHQNLCRAWL
jgi:hypothetical protein